MATISNLSNDDLQRLKEKYVSQLIEIDCEIRKRLKIKEFQSNLTAELDKLKESGLREMGKVKLSRSKEHDDLDDSPKAKSRTKKSEKENSSSSSDRYKFWTIKIMQRLLDKRCVEYKKSSSRDEYIRLIQNNSLVREMNSITS
jgi:hypothetical protein